ncbi:MAG: alpha/beta hydrolase [Flammeovirgaceae bacterium]|nr:alpha/beta hydrolase [Flammeovirgaceae bacterium]
MGMFLYQSIIGCRPTSKHPAHAQDVADAVAWIAKNAHHYSIDPRHIYLMGHSAGAHLVSLVSTDKSYLEKAGASTDLIKGTVVLDGAGYDIPLLMKEGGDKLKKIYGEVFGESKKEWINASPVHHVSAEKNIAPFFIAHAGNREMAEKEGKIFSETLSKANVRNRLVHYPDHNHMTINRLFGSEVDPVCKDVIEFLGWVANTTVAESK